MDRNVALDWFNLVGESLEGVIAKRLDRPYHSGGRGSVVKIKKHQTMDCVVGGFTHTEDRLAVASLLLGVFDETDSLRYVGGIRLTQAEGKRVLKELASIEHCVCDRSQASAFSGSKASPAFVCVRARCSSCKCKQSLAGHS